MLVIRFFRVGKKNQPFFKIVVTDKRKSSTRSRFVEQVGNWNPLTKEKVLKQERIKYWLSVGAKPSATVHNLLVSEKIIEGKKIDVHKKKKEKSKEEVPPAEAPKTEGPKEEKPLKKEPEKELPKEEKPAEEKLAKKTEPKTEEKPIKGTLKEDKSSFRPPPSEEGPGKKE